LWCVTGAEEIASLQQLMRDKALFIADGHHRYETALSLRRSREGKYPEDFAMMALVNMKSDGLVVLPTHRTIFGVARERFQSGIERLEADFAMRRLDSREVTAVNTALRSTAQAKFAAVVATNDAAYLLSADREQLQRRFPNGMFELDVEALHSLFEGLFGITAADVRAQKHVRYHRFVQEALEDVESGAQAAFLIRPVPIELIRDRSLRAVLMPQKSTDFYPKMNSGLTSYSWDESFIAQPSKVSQGGAPGGD
jgi:uncharacterized protein (DUF1015 family)